MPPSPEIRPSLSGRATSAGVEHALLSYRYLNEDDLDGYASLLDWEARFAPTGVPRGQGPEAAATLVFDRCGGQGWHHPERVIASGADVVVTGTLTRPAPGRPTTEEFADFFTVSEHGLLSTWRRFREPGSPT